MVRWAVLALAAGSVVAQPRIGLIEFFGNRRTSDERIAKALGVKAGDAIPPDRVALEARLEEMNGVARASVEAACCADGGKAILYVGLEERGAVHFEPRSPEDGEPLSLPAPEDGAALVRVARRAEESSIRADAAILLGELPPTQAVIDALQYAAQDADPLVRRAAVRGLVRMAQHPTVKDPEMKLQVAPTWMIEMLNSVVFSDRQSAVEALMALTDTPDPLLIAKIRERALPSLFEMARWQHLEHALPAYLLLARVGGVNDDEAQGIWKRGERETLVQRIQKESKKK